MGYHSIIPPFLGERAAWGILHLLASGWGQGHTPQKRWWQQGWGLQGRWESCSNAQTQCCTELLAAVMQCMMHLGRTEMAVKETREIQKAAKWCMSAKRSVSWQIICLRCSMCRGWCGAQHMLLASQDVCPSGRSTGVSAQWWCNWVCLRGGSGTH